MFFLVFPSFVTISYTIGKKLAIRKIYIFQRCFRQKMMQSYKLIRNRDLSRLRRSLVRNSLSSGEVI